MNIQEFIIKTSRGAGEIIKSGFGNVKNRRTKGGDRGDIVTDVDFESERYVVDRIRSAFPDHAIYSEEAGALGESPEGYLWLIDPIDGTRNFATGIPFFCVSIALAKDGVAQYGAVYDPIHDELFFAERGEGATLNGVTIQVSSEKSLADAIVSVSWTRKDSERKTFVNYIDRMAHETSYFRRFGSAALISAYVACGRADLYLQGQTNPYDIAAGAILVEEAGGVVTDFAGNPLDLRKPKTDILAANPELHRMILGEVIRG